MPYDIMVVIRGLLRERQFISAPIKIFCIYSELPFFVVVHRTFESWLTCFFKIDYSRPHTRVRGEISWAKIFIRLKDKKVRNQRIYKIQQFCHSTFFTRNILKYHAFFNDF